MPWSRISWPFLASPCVCVLPNHQCLPDVGLLGLPLQEEAGQGDALSRITTVCSTDCKKGGKHPGCAACWTAVMQQLHQQQQAAGVVQGGGGGSEAGGAEEQLAVQAAEAEMVEVEDVQQQQQQQEQVEQQVEEQQQLLPVEEQPCPASDEVAAAAAVAPMQPRRATRHTPAVAPAGDKAAPEAAEAPTTRTGRGKKRRAPDAPAEAAVPEAAAQPAAASEVATGEQQPGGEPLPAAVAAPALSADQLRSTALRLLGCGKCQQARSGCGKCRSKVAAALVSRPALRISCWHAGMLAAIDAWRCCVPDLASG